MKNVAKRLCGGVLASLLALILSMTPWISMTAKADAPTSGQICSMMEGKMYLDSVKNSFIWYSSEYNAICYDNYLAGTAGNRYFDETNVVTASTDPAYDHMIETFYDIFLFKIENGSVTKIKWEDKSDSSVTIAASLDSARDARLSKVLGMMGSVYKVEMETGGMFLKEIVEVSGNTFSNKGYMGEELVESSAGNKFVNAIETAEGWRLFWFENDPDDGLDTRSLEKFGLIIKDGKVSALTRYGMEYSLVKTYDDSSSSGSSGPHRLTTEEIAYIQAVMNMAASTPAQTAPKTSPNTGENSNYYVFVLMALAVIGVIRLTFIKKRYNH